jgi:hypothetical protein
MMKFLSKLVEFKILVNWGMVHSREKHMLTDSVQSYNKPIIDLACSVSTVKYQTSVFWMDLAPSSLGKKPRSDISQYRPHAHSVNKPLLFSANCNFITSIYHLSDDEYIFPANRFIWNIGRVKLHNDNNIQNIYRSENVFLKLFRYRDCSGAWAISLRRRRYRIILV